MSHHHKQFSIRFAGLPEGMHAFDFELNRDFFTEYYSENEFSDALVSVHIDAERTSTVLILDLQISGFVTVECDRCLDPCQVDIETDQTLIFSSAGEHHYPVKDDDSIVEISAETDEVILNSYLYDFVLLALPLRRVHDELDPEHSACNREMLERIDNLQIKHTDDPRWEKLKKLKTDNN